MRSALCVLAVLAALPASAGAATRYAAPDGGAANDCSAPDAAHACDIPRAITVANGGDEVLLASGTYPIAATVSVSKSLLLRGPATGTKPRLVGAAGLAATVSLPAAGSGSIVRDLAIENQADSGRALEAAVNAGSLEGLQLTASGAGGMAARFQLHTAEASTLRLRNSTARTTGAGSVAVLAVRLPADGPLNSTMALVNVTADARGGDSIGIAARGSPQMSGCANVHITARNVIAQGTRSDTEASGYASSCATTLDLYMSNWRTEQESSGGSVVGHESAQVAPPKFVDAAGGNYHQADDSPTRDAGGADPALLATDIDGDTRTYGAAPDIGADEWVPPPPPATPSPSPSPSPVATVVGPASWATSGSIPSGQSVLKSRILRVRVTSSRAMAFLATGTAGVTGKRRREAFGTVLGASAGGKTTEIRMRLSRAAARRLARARGRKGTLRFSVRVTAIEPSGERRTLKLSGGAKG
jgi:hypothetical protein